MRLLLLLAAMPLMLVITGLLFFVSIVTHS